MPGIFLQSKYCARVVVDYRERCLLTVDAIPRESPARVLDSPNNDKNPSPRHFLPDIATHLKLIHFPRAPEPTTPINHQSCPPGPLTTVL